MSGWNRPQHLSVSPPSPPFRGAGGYKPPAITAPFPGACPSETSSRFAANHPIPSPVTFSRAANPAPGPSSDDGIRTPNTATDLQPLTRFTVFPPQHDRTPPTYPALSSPRRGDTHTVQVTPYKRSAVWCGATTHRPNEKAMRRPAKRNLRLASRAAAMRQPYKSSHRLHRLHRLIASSSHRLIAFIASSPSSPHRLHRLIVSSPHRTIEPKRGAPTDTPKSLTSHVSRLF